MTPVKKREFHRRVRREHRGIQEKISASLCALCGSKELFAVESVMTPVKRVF
jgi:hypothetical protein